MSPGEVLLLAGMWNLMGFYQASRGKWVWGMVAFAVSMGITFVGMNRP